MKQVFIGIILSNILFSSVYSQAYRATLNENGENSKIEIILNKNHKANEIEQLSPWPLSFAPDANFKNMRGLCLENIDGIPGDEIIFAAKNKIYAYNSSGEQLWSKNLIGTAVYPPAAADITGDGNIEIVQVTGGMPNNGRVYVFDKNGNILPGWPVSFNNNWIICSPTIADIDNDGQMEIIVNERLTNGKIHILKVDGSSFSENWPKVLDGIPAVTTGIAYCPKTNSLQENIIIAASTKSIYAFDTNGNTFDGFPITIEGRSYSYQSPLILKDDSGIKIIGANHGENPGFYIINESGSFLDNWPKPTADNSWTYTAPLAFGIDDQIDFFMFGQPGGTGDFAFPALHAFNSNGEYYTDFPFERIDGNEGFISAIYLEEDNLIYIFTGSNMKVEGYGSIHAYSCNPDFTDFKILEGFPVAVKGFTFMNGVNLGDVNANGKLNLVVLSYDLDFAETDSVHINIFELDNIFFNPDYCFGTYRGSNLRTGFVTPLNINNKVGVNPPDDIKIYPNPVKDYVLIETNDFEFVEIFDLHGRIIKSDRISNSQANLNISKIQSGIYFVRLIGNNKSKIKKVIKL